MPRNKFSVGDLVTHTDGGDAIFVIQGSLEPVDPKDPALYQCSLTRSYNFDWHNYLGTDLSRAEGVPEEQKPDAIKRAALVLYRLLEAAQEGGMRQKRAERLHEEFCDHWLQNDDPEKMKVLSRTLEHVEELLRQTRNTT